MKKVMMICMMLLLSVSLCFSASADPGWFVSSPSGNAAPELIVFVPGDENCTAKPVVTPYAQRDQLTQEDRLAIEKAYRDIATSTDLGALCGDLATLAQQQNIPATNLEVSDLFDLSTTDCTEHESHKSFTVTLKAETLENFVGLLHYNNGTWELIQPARVEGDRLTFNAENMSPFAIVVNTGDAVVEEEDGKIDPLNLLAYCTILTAAALSVIVLWKKSN